MDYDLNIEQQNKKPQNNEVITSRLPPEMTPYGILKIPYVAIYLAPSVNKPQYVVIVARCRNRRRIRYSAVQRSGRRLNFCLYQITDNC